MEYCGRNSVCCSELSHAEWLSASNIVLPTIVICLWSVMFTRGDFRLRYLYIAWAILENVGYGGLAYGWGSLVYVLKDEGLYLDLCATGNDTLQTLGNAPGTDCHSRASKLELVYTIASTCIGLGCCFTGLVQFSYGTRISRIFSSLIFMTGAYVVAFVTNETPWLIFPGMSCLAFGGIGFLLTNYQIANLLPVGGATLIGAMNGALEASDAVQLMVKFGYENGINRRTSYLILASTNILTFISTFLFLPKDLIRPVYEPSDLSLTNHILTEKLEKSETKKELDLKSLLGEVLTPNYLLHLLWFSALYLRFNCMIGSMNRTLELQLNANKDEVSRYTNAMLYIMMGGIVTSSLCGAFLELNVACFKNCRAAYVTAVKPTLIPLALTTAIGVSMSALVACENPDHLYVIFVHILLFRSSMFTFGSAYIIRGFHNQYSTAIIGINNMMGCLIALSQHAFFEWSGRRPAIEANTFLLLLTILTFVHPLWQWNLCRKLEKQALHGYDRL